MVDTELIANQLRSRGYTVTHIHGVPENAGEYEFTVDGKILTLEETRDLLTADEAAGPSRNDR